MDEKIALATLGALWSGSVGGMLVKLLFSSKYNFVIVLWIMGFCASFTILLVGYRGNDLAVWLAVVLGCSLLPVIGYFGYRNLFDDVADDRGWGFGSGVFLLLISTLLTFNAAWWVKRISGFFMLECGWLIFLLTTLTVGCIGLAAVFAQGHLE